MDTYSLEAIFESGFLNIVARPFGGYLGDALYRSFGTKGKKFWTLLCGLIMGVTLVSGGFYLQNNRINGDAQRASQNTVSTAGSLIQNLF
jgi:hypothetical protein